MAKKPVVKMVDKKTKTKEVPKTQVEKKPLPKAKDFKEYLNVFEFSTTLPGSKEEIRFKPLTVGGLKRMLTNNSEEVNPIILTDIFDKMFKEYILNEDFDPEDLYLKDREFLILEMRKKSKGEKNRFQYTCPKCKSQSPQILDFDKIPILEIDMDNVNYIVDLTDELSVKMQFLTRKLEREIYELWPAIVEEFNNPNEQEAELALYLQAQAIDEIITPDGPQKDITLYDKKYLIENIPSDLYDNISEWSQENNFGPQLEIEVECPHCKHIEKHDFTSLDFFD